MNLKGRVALVTGAGRGIGRAIALRLAQEGAAIAVNDIVPEGALKTAEDVAALGVPAIGLPGDVSVRKNVSAMIADVIASYGQLDILVNNAGIIQDRLLMRMSDEQWESVIAVNLRSVFLCSKASVRPMLKGNWGRIISLSSITGLIGKAGQTNYAAAKAGIIGFTRAFAREVGAHGITVNAIAPGFIKTDMTAHLPDKQQRETMSRIPVGFLGEVGDIAAACAFLASEDARYVTGHVLTVDGGLTCI